MEEEAVPLAFVREWAARRREAERARLGSVTGDLRSLVSLEGDIAPALAYFAHLDDFSTLPLRALIPLVSGLRTTAPSETRK